MCRVLTNGSGDQRSIPGRAIQKMVLNSTLLNISLYALSMWCICMAVLIRPWLGKNYVLFYQRYTF